MKKMIRTQVVMLALVFVSAARLSAQDTETSYVSIPGTVSREAGNFLRTLRNSDLNPAWPAPGETGKWKALQRAAEANSLKNNKALLARLRPIVEEKNIGGVPVLDIKPRSWKDNGTLIVHIHGGAYVFNSARSMLGSSALMADATGRRVISVDYSLAPHARWQQVVQQVVTVFAGLKKAGNSMKDIAVFGDSAGGGLATGAVLRMRDLGMEMPAALVLWSPWTDITETGDTYVTLKHAEPFYLYEKHLKPAADAYAEPKDQKNPYVSPVYGDYGKDFPPVLIQGGTKEILLSGFIRLYQALDTKGRTVKLDLYEGMPHVFQVQIVDSPESKIARAKVVRFLTRYLGR